jgi:hypothetical protein
MALFVPPLLATLVAISPVGNKVFLSLTLLNAFIYAFACLGEHKRVALHLLLISLVALVCGFPEDWGRRIFAGFNRAECLVVASAVYGLFWAMRSRNPASGVLGGLIAGIVTGGIMASANRPDVVHWALQAGLVLLLIHSLRWEDRYHSGAAALRVLASGFWVAHTIVWMHTTGVLWMACCTTAPLLAAYAVARIITGEWGPRILPIAILLVILSGPTGSGAVKLRTVPLGVLAVIGSFVLFAIGTAAALTRHRWHKAR